MPRKEGISCASCHDEILGKTVAEAIADAKAIGWEERSIGRVDLGWHCADCILEEEKL